MEVSSLHVEKIPNKEAKPWILQRHYAHRMPCIEWAFGLFNEKVCVGIVTYGTPASAPLRTGICGPKYKVLELNRLCLSDSAGKNAASKLIATSLKQLPPCVVVSYADTSYGHIGYVYQATNWIYTGLSAKRTDWHVKGLEGLHGQTIADKTRGMPDRASTIRAMYGNDFSLVDRPRKHRYVYFVGSKRTRKKMKQALRYAILPYPKGETARYDTSEPIYTQTLLFGQRSRPPTGGKGI